LEKEIFCDGQSVGTAVIEKEGGYYRIRARCAYREGIWRLYMTVPGKFCRLGVCIPSSGTLMLSRRISPHELGLDPTDCTLTLLPGEQTPSVEVPEVIQLPVSSFLLDTKENRSEEFPPTGMIDRWCNCGDAAAFTQDAVLKPLLAGADGILYRYSGGGIELAVPAEISGAISAVLCLTRTEQIRGRDYFVLSLDGSGDPAAAEPSSRY